MRQNSLKQQILVVVEKALPSPNLRPFGQIYELQVIADVQALKHLVGLSNWIQGQSVHAVDLLAIGISGGCKLSPNPDSSLDVPVLAALLGQSTGQQAGELVGQVVGMAHSLDSTAESHEAVRKDELLGVEVEAVEVHWSPGGMGVP